MDLTSPKTVRQLCRQFDFTFKKGLGQNFLTSQQIIDAVAEAACPNGGSVVEIGPGFGVLTAALCRRAKKVVSVEIDERLLPVLRYTLAEFDNVEIINNDIMKTDLKKLVADHFGSEPVSAAANLPYYITTPVIAKLLESRLPFEHIVVMVQKEVAQRLCASPGTKEYGAVSVMCQYYSKPQIIAKVPAGLFVPPPKVDSAVLSMTPFKEPPVNVRSEKLFFRTVKAAFSQRRKTLANCISSGFSLSKEDASSVLANAGVIPSRRGETLSLEEFALIADSIFDFTGGENIG